MFFSRGIFLSRQILICKRFNASTSWTYKEAIDWQKSFHKEMIPKDHVSISFSRSSGPGGQNVNKVSTKVDLRLSLAKADWLPEYAKEKIRNSSQLRKSKNDELISTSDRTRSQAKNIEDCYSKLVDVIRESVSVVKEPDQATLLRVEKLRCKEDKNRREYKKKQSQKKTERKSRGNDY